MSKSIREALLWGQKQLPRFEARLLLSAVLDQPVTYLIAYDDEKLPVEAWDSYQMAIGRAANGEPVPYIIGSAPFYGRDFQVSPAVLIPRPETELLIEEALTFCQSRAETRIIDVGTGSGCIAVTMAAELEMCKVDITAVDVSGKALKIARANGKSHVPDKISFRISNLLGETEGRFDLILANLPYVTEEEYAQLDYSVQQHEPKLALVGGLDGLDLVRRLLDQAQQRIGAGGLILLEIGWKQGDAAVAVAREAFPNAKVYCLPDLAGKDRLIKIALQ